MGALWTPSNLDPRDQTRSYAKTAYHDRSARRQNYHLLAQQQVTRVLFTDKKATGVEVTPPSPVLEECCESDRK
jgi:choline dehydrogenase-like flavoprotein